MRAMQMGSNNSKGATVIRHNGVEITLDDALDARITNGEVRQILNRLTEEVEFVERQKQEEVFKMFYT